tara:strand:+ start:2132 stop:2317 length:186 start_codon:yes stop_codon:yes gene_type:complete
MDTDKIKQYLVKNGIKQSWLAKRLSISDTYLSLILSGDRVPPEWFESDITNILNKQGDQYE